MQGSEYEVVKAAYFIKMTDNLPGICMSLKVHFLSLRFNYIITLRNYANYKDTIR